MQELFFALAPQKYLHSPKKKSTFASQKQRQRSIAAIKGEMAEWSIAAVLKTVEGHTSGGSNPSLSAKHLSNRLIISDNQTVIFLCYRQK